MSDVARPTLCRSGINSYSIWHMMGELHFRWLMRQAVDSIERFAVATSVVDGVVSS